MSPDPAIRILIGLGNPGPQYAKTRHNWGAALVRFLAHAHHTPFQHHAETHTQLASFPDLRLAISTRYMNENGRSVYALLRYFRMAPASMLVVHDDLELPEGVLRLKHGGGHGGHNGLRDILQHLTIGFPEQMHFTRLRIGIGRPKTAISPAQYVLEPLADRAHEALFTQIQATALPLLAPLLPESFLAPLHR